MASKVSGLLSQALAPEIQRTIYGPRLEKEFAAGFPSMSAVNQAHVVMLATCKIISPEVGQALAAVLLDIEKAGPDAVERDPAREDAYFNYEAKVIADVGPDIGGRMHIGRSRNDLAATIQRMRSRDACLDILDVLATVRRTALDRAAENARVVMPGYTHLQPAQPITFGYYLLGIAQAFERDFERLAGAYRRIDLNPLGAGAFAGTSFPIDRRQTQRLLGFDGLLEHGQDAVASRDFAIEMLAGCATLGLTWSRLAQDLYVMTSHEFGTVTFPDSVVGTSSIMPQKRNPVALEHLKGRSAHLIGSLTSMMAAVKGTHFTNTYDGNTEALHGYFDSLADTVAALEIVNLVLTAVEPEKARMLSLAQENFSTATELADALVREADLSFREAHHVVGAVVRAALEKGLTANRIPAELVRDIGRRIVGKAISISDDTVSRCLDAVRAVDQRAGIGGPAPTEVLRMVEEARGRLDRSVKECEDRRSVLKAARATRIEQVSALARGLR